jgi:hypothetical protein
MVGPKDEIRNSLRDLWARCRTRDVECDGVPGPRPAQQKYRFGQAQFSIAAQPESIATGDFKGGGRRDFAVVNPADNTISTILGSPDGAFAPRVDYATGSNPVMVVAGDLNADGKLDLVIGRLIVNAPGRIPCRDTPGRPVQNSRHLHAHRKGTASGSIDLYQCWRSQRHCSCDTAIARRWELTVRNCWSEPRFCNCF